MNTPIDELIERLNLTAAESAKVASKESNKRTSKETLEEARLPFTIGEPSSDGVDEMISSIIEIYKAADSASRKAIASKLNEFAARRILGYSVWAATLAVRTQSVALIENGLVAVVIENSRDDWRNSIMSLALLYHSAVKLGMDAVKTFANIARLAEPGVVQKEMAEFPLRQPKDRDLKAFYLLEEGAGQSFVYKQIPWWTNFQRKLDNQPS